MSMRKRWPLMSIGDLFVVASTQNEEEASSPQVRQLIWFLIAQWRWWWWGWLKHPLHQSCWPNSKQTNHPLGGRYQPITREHSQMTSQSASVPFLPKLLFFIFLFILCRRSNTSSFHLFVLTDALACLTEGKTDWADLDLKFWERQLLCINTHSASKRILFSRDAENILWNVCLYCLYHILSTPKRRHTCCFVVVCLASTPQCTVHEAYSGSRLNLVLNIDDDNDDDMSSAIRIFPHSTKVFIHQANILFDWESIDRQSIEKNCEKSSKLVSCFHAISIWFTLPSFLQGLAISGAMKYAVEQINNCSSLLPGVQLDFLFNDTKVAYLDHFSYPSCN